MPGWLWSPQLWFSRPKNLCSLNDLSGLNSLNGLNDLDSLSSSNFLLIMIVGSSLAPKLPIRRRNFTVYICIVNVLSLWTTPYGAIILPCWFLAKKTSKFDPLKKKLHNLTVTMDYKFQVSIKVAQIGLGTTDFHKKPVCSSPPGSPSKNSQRNPRSY